MVGGGPWLPGWLACNLLPSGKTGMMHGSMCGHSTVALGPWGHDGLTAR